MLKISIPKPCHEDWDHMLPNQQGRHCFSCEKTVVDFTKMTDEEVKNFLINQKDKKICGRFTSIQLQQISIELPQNIFQLQLPLWKQFLVASLLVFSSTLFSCEANTKGDVISLNSSSHAIDHRNVVDTAPAKINAVVQPTESPVRCTSKGEVKATQLMGDTVVVEQPVPDRPLMGDISIVVKDTVVTNPPAPEVMGKLMINPEKPKVKKRSKKGD